MFHWTSLLEQSCLLWICGERNERALCICSTVHRSAATHLVRLTCLRCPCMHLLHTSVLISGIYWCTHSVTTRTTVASLLASALLQHFTAHAHLILANLNSSTRKPLSDLTYLHISSYINENFKFIKILVFMHFVK